MFFIPLNQLESVELVIHALRAAGGQADCTACPARRVCMKQCLTIADAVGRLLQAGTLPSLEPEAGPSAPQPEPQPPASDPGARDRLRVVK